jgi:2-C-methyl-D-erythritol 4-phosphate cytidylyltransferase
VVIVTPFDWVDHVVQNYPKCITVEGGTRRQDSSLNGVLATNINSENVLIHDAARPFLTTEIIDDCLSALKNSDASAPIMDSTNSLIEFKENQISSVNRQNIKSVQTPQCFKRNLILDVLKSSIEGTDEMGMLLKFDHSKKIQLVDGGANNIKITTKTDLTVATSILEGLN